VALNGLLCADVPLRNYSLTHHSQCVLLTVGRGSGWWGISKPQVPTYTAWIVSWS